MRPGHCFLTFKIVQMKRTKEKQANSEREDKISGFPHAEKFRDEARLERGGEPKPEETRIKWDSRWLPKKNKTNLPDGRRNDA